MAKMPETFLPASAAHTRASKDRSRGVAIPLRVPVTLVIRARQIQVLDGANLLPPRIGVPDCASTAFLPPQPEDVSQNLLRAQSAASRVPPKILTYVQVCCGFRLPPLLAAWAPRDDFWTHLES